MATLMKSLIIKMVDFSARRPILVLVVSLLCLIASWSYASHLDLRSDFLELLPRDSPGFAAFEHQLGRVGGRGSLLVLADSPDVAANERLIDAVADAIEGWMDERSRCVAACTTPSCPQTCAPPLIAYVERGTKDVHAFVEEFKWLYASPEDLDAAYDRVDHRIAIRSGLVESLDDEEVADKPGGDSSAAADKSSALGLGELRGQMKSKYATLDEFPSGYFATPDGHTVGLRIVSRSTGTGDRLGDLLYAHVRTLVERLRPVSFDPAMRVGFAGDIPNAVAEKQSLVSSAAWASVLVLVVILAGIVLFYGSLWSIPTIALPALLGVGFAYSFAMARFGYVNTSGAFLGAIILGNGINYPIVLLSRYREFRARGLTPQQARRDAVLNAFRAELVGACVGSIAYGSLTITRFRGFNQFGLIGFVGMLLVWVTIIPCVPAMIALQERVEAHFPVSWRERERHSIDGMPGPVIRFVARVTARAPWAFVLGAMALSALALSRLPAYLRDPWEYDFDKLGSKGSKAGGAAEWSIKADDVFGGKNNISGAVMLADTPDQVPLLKAQILKNDAADPQGPLIHEVLTVADVLPGTEQEQRAKIAILDRIRDRLTPAVLHGLSPEERLDVDDLTPPQTLRPVGAKDLPSLLRRRFQENNGTVGTVFYVKYRNDVVLSNGHNLLRIARATDNVVLPDGTKVLTASRATIFAEMIRSMVRDGPLATVASFGAVVVVVLIATHDLVGALVVLTSLAMGVLWTLGGAAAMNVKLNFLNFIALPITFGVGCEYPFNVYDRSRLLGGNVTSALHRVGGAVALCSYTTTIGYSSLLLADMQALQSFGWVAMSGEVACLASALFVVPSMLHLISPSRRPRQDGSGVFAVDGVAPLPETESATAPSLPSRSGKTMGTGLPDSRR
ncbi:MAG: MMPL family transporter [Polyangiaceae bacterium]|jgi:predicted RND superfamily exporter protein